MFRIEMLPADEGDCLWIEYGKAASPHRLIIDAGRKSAYATLVQRLAALKEPNAVFVMTHVDDDHIFGAVPLFADVRIHPATFRDVWYNGYTHLDREVGRKPAKDVLGPLNGEILAALLLKGGHPWNEAFDRGASIVVPEEGALPRIDLPGGLAVTLLSPTWDGLTTLKAFWERELEDLKPGDAEAALAIFSDRRSLQPDVLGGLLDVDDLVEARYEADTRAPNGSSIAFIAEHAEHAVLFAGDAHPSVLEASLTRLLQERGLKTLKLDALKVSHHGSKHNTSPRLLELLDCSRFLISTNGKRHGHPDPECIARILHRNQARPAKTELYFNYRTPQNETWADAALMDDWNYSVHFPPTGHVVDL